jgi:hypothetical protein
LFLKSLSVVDKFVINDLSNQRDRSLGLVFISLGHVEIIQEVDQNLTGRRSVVLTSLFDDLRFEQGLESFGVSIGVERHTGLKGGIGVKGSQEIFDVGGLTGSSLSDIEATLSGENVQVQEESLASSGRGRNDEVLIETLEFLVHWWGNSVPSNPIISDGIEVVVEDLTSFRELLFGESLEVVGEGVLVFIHTTSKRPEGTKGEESIVDTLNGILVAFFLKGFEMLKLGLISVESLIEIIDDAGQRANLLHVTDGGNVRLILEGLNVRG